MKPLKEETKKKLLELTGIEYTEAEKQNSVWIALYFNKEDRWDEFRVNSADQWLKENTVDAEEELKIISDKIRKLNLNTYGLFYYDNPIFHDLAMWFKNHYDYGKETN